MNNARGNRPSVGFVSTYPPTACGLATFTAALRGAIAEGRGSGEGLRVVRLVEGGQHATPHPEVSFQHLNGDRTSLVEAADVLNQHDVALFQHEYGIYGGPDGVEILDLMERVEVPSIVTLHTVLTKSSPRQKQILETIVEQSAGSVVMSDTALSRLIARYDVDPDKVSMIPHGAMAGLAGPTVARGSRPLVITWGLIGPGKGLETALEALTLVSDLRPVPRYLILGRTHPKIQATEGDAYMESLKARVETLGLEGVVEFDGRYLDVDTLCSIIRQADIALLPYQSTEQVTSGVLVEAMAAGKPVVATPFPHAVEMLSTGAGLLVPHGNPEAMAGALRRLITEPGLSAGAAQMAASIGATLHWPVVAEQYEAMAAESAGQRLRVPALPRRPTDGLARVG